MTPTHKVKQAIHSKQMQTNQQAQIANKHTGTQIKVSIHQPTQTSVAHIDSPAEGILTQLAMTELKTNWVLNSARICGTIVG